MRGEEDRECRARGGGVKKQSRKNVEREFHGAHAHNTPDASAKRGAGPIFRAEGGRVARQLGGAIAGAAKKPNPGRAGRARGGGVGADLKPLTSADKPRKPEGGQHFMPDSERTP